MCKLNPHLALARFIARKYYEARATDEAEILILGPTDLITLWDLACAGFNRKEDLLECREEALEDLGARLIRAEDRTEDSL